MKLKEEDHGRMFLSNKAQDVVNTLIKQINENKVNVMEETPVTEISHDNGIFMLQLKKVNSKVNL